MRRILTASATALALLGFAGIPAASAASSSTSYQIIDYHGYEIQVPASWPVYDLVTDPTRCVLFNQHAVYLGTPGADQQCPPRAFGRTEAILIQPEQTTVPTGTVALGTDTASFAGALGSAESTGHTVQFTAPGPGVQVTATYGTDEAQIRTILAGARMTAKTSAKAPTVTAPSAAFAEASDSAAGHAAAGHALDKSDSSAAKAKAEAESTSSAASGWELSEEQGQGLGIDTCTVPSAATMRDWLASPYRVVSTYLGGANWACSYGDFTDSWVAEAASEGWQFIPIWVGPQAPCTQLTGTTEIDPSDAAAEGESEAAGAVAAAQEFGYGTGTPIYYDMESYDNADTSCSQAVTSFLGGWTEGLHSAGYLSGVYSSAATGISDLANLYGTSGYESPDDVWFADWNTEPVDTSPYFPGSDWQNAVMHQYYGTHDETWGGATLEVDSDVVDAATAGYPDASGVGQPTTVTDEPAAVSVSPGGAGSRTQLEIQAGGATSVVHWQADPPAGVTVTPDSGNAIVSGGGQVSVSLQVSGGTSLASGRYDVPITAYANGQQITETFLLVSSGSAVASPVVLYAADAQSMDIAAAEAQQLALPGSDITGNFETAWTDASSGSDVVIAVGAAATDALFYNDCGWTNPAGDSAGSTPFGYSSLPLNSGTAGGFEGADGSGGSAIAAESMQFAQYAMAGTSPDVNAGRPFGSYAPTDTCLGSADVPVP